MKTLGSAPTIRDVARACGLSHMTVSNVMNNRPVSETTRQQVLQAMRELNYQPSAIARGLNRKPMDTLGVVLPETYGAPTSHPYFAPVLDGIMAAAVTMHKDVTIYTGSLWAEDGEGLRRYRDGRSDGLLLISAATQYNLVRSLLEFGLPFVVVGYSFKEASYVSVDEDEAFRSIVEHLYNQGHRRIVYVSRSEDPGFHGHRHTGFEFGMKSVGLPLNDNLIYYTGFSEPRLRDAADAIAAMPKSIRPTAVCTFNDELAIRMINELVRCGLRVPEDISVTGFDDSVVAQECNITTVRQPLRKIGLCAAQTLVDILRTGDKTPRQECFKTELIVRSTSGPAPS